jgi:hypothetical protein
MKILIDMNLSPAWVRIPTQTGHLFRSNPAGHSGAWGQVYFISITSLAPLESFRETKDDLNLALRLWVYFVGIIIIKKWGTLPCFWKAWSHP